MVSAEETWDVQDYQNISFNTFKIVYININTVKPVNQDTWK